MDLEIRTSCKRLQDYVKPDISITVPVGDPLHGPVMKLVLANCSDNKDITMTPELKRFKVEPTEDGGWRWKYDESRKKRKIKKSGESRKKRKRKKGGESS